MVTLNYWNLDGQNNQGGDPVQMPLCPLCDNPIERGEEVNLVEADGYLGLAHRMCCLAADEDDDE